MRTVHELPAAPAMPGHSLPWPGVRSHGHGTFTATATAATSLTPDRHRDADVVVFAHLTGKA
ncbi:hypothetical protein AB0O22_10730 [Streptomyces sp. NPDC091204]|uniref:hypothetical protein n=1 Tax=Streptomyces sp. NPDC091204 TaxID=3155299 RepID=UPI00342449D1